MTDLENKEAFKAWFKKEYLGIDALANQGDEGGSPENLNHSRSPA